MFTVGGDQTILSGPYSEDELVRGMAVYLNDLTFERAALTASAPAFQVVGLVKTLDDVGTCTVRTFGDLKLDDWSLALGLPAETAYLEPGKEYYASDEELGQITTTRPTASGSHVVSIGVARTKVVLALNIRYYGEIP